MSSGDPKIASAVCPLDGKGGADALNKAGAKYRMVEERPRLHSTSGRIPP